MLNAQMKKESSMCSVAQFKCHFFRVETHQQPTLFRIAIEYLVLALRLYQLNRFWIRILEKQYKSKIFFPSSQRRVAFHLGAREHFEKLISRHENKLLRLNQHFPERERRRL